MTDTPEDRPAKGPRRPGQAGNKADQRAEREKRLAEALRANLRRRKGQARANGTKGDGPDA